ncbi:tubby-like protein 8 isoform X1 [Rhododendron vialii]|uniref:tubby-like protein 8 isoform X1 n=1 Tax=Rhododendron vialii TaxID=182163 RepID=UPI00265E2035|nr:tubby-like protein 8 isoform X1 [Rhododendron vialii]XP_058195760.1 tubby-like protein 8 isoform X1 [Rhododendron vialii]
MSGFKKSSFPRQSSYNSLYVNPLNEIKHNRSCSEGGALSDDKENATPNKPKNSISGGGKENEVPSNGYCIAAAAKQTPNGKSCLRDRALKPSSLQLCMQQNDPSWTFGSKSLDPIEFETANSGNIWDYSDSEAAPASSWAALPNRSLLCRPLPVDIGKCTCVIVKEASPEGLAGGTLYSLYTNEGKGRQDRKLAVAHHRRHNGRSEFVVAQNMKGIFSSLDDSFIGIVTANLMGSKYHVWDQGNPHSSSKQSKDSKPPLAVVSFVPTIATWTGSYRSMRVWISKHQSMLLKSTSQVQHVAGLPKDWEGKANKVHQLFSRIPHYNNQLSKQYELDYRDRTQVGLRIQSSVKNFQLILEENGKQTILQLGRVAKSKYVMDYRYPLTGFQAFCICLASIDSKLCCAL